MTTAKMSDPVNQDHWTYIEMKIQGDSAEEILIKAKEDGFKNYECLALISDVFEMELHEAREVLHRVYM